MHLKQAAIIKEGTICGRLAAIALLFLYLAAPLQANQRQSKFPTKDNGMHTVFLPHSGKRDTQTTNVLKVKTAQVFKLLTRSPTSFSWQDQFEVSLDGKNFHILPSSPSPFVLVAGPAWIRYVRRSEPLNATVFLSYAVYNKYRFPANVNY
jgi:hypothetical protein